MSTTPSDSRPASRDAADAVRPDAVPPDGHPTTPKRTLPRAEGPIEVGPPREPRLAVLVSSDRGRMQLLVAGFVLITVLRFWLGETTTGISYFYAAPVALASTWYGTRGALVAGAVAAVLVLVGFVVPGIDRPVGSILTATIPRAGLFFGVGYLVAWLVGRERLLQETVEEQGRELDELRGIQEALTPAILPDRPGLELAVAFAPAEQRLAGDFYLVASGPGDTTTIVVGDVAGHGAAAARQAAYVRTLMTSFAEYVHDAQQLLALTNAAMRQSTASASHFVTAVCATYDPETHRLSYALAGHPPPLAVGGGDHPPAPAPGLPLGIVAEWHAETAVAELDGFGGVLLYTDGLNEARRQHAEDEAPPRYGDARLEEQLGALVGDHPREVVGELHQAVTRFVGGPLADDLCILALRPDPR